jgi:hypothetical protein
MLGEVPSKAKDKAKGMMLMIAFIIKISFSEYQLSEFLRYVGLIFVTSLNVVFFEKGGEVGRQEKSDFGSGCHHFDGKKSWSSVWVVNHFD